MASKEELNAIGIETETNIIICENCYEENESTRTTCKNCGSKLYKNSELGKKENSPQNENKNIEAHYNKKSNLINCNDCGKKISENAVTCPNCGATNIFNNEIAPMWVKIICFIIPIIGWWIFAFNISTKPKYAKDCFIASILLTIILLIVAIVLCVSIFSMNSSNIFSSSDYSSYDYSSSSEDSLPYCKKSDCYNRVSYSWRKYCDTHSYLEY